MRRGIRAVKPVRYAARGKYINGDRESTHRPHVGLHLDGAAAGDGLAPLGGDGDLGEGSGHGHGGHFGMFRVSCRRIGVCGNGDPRPRKSRFLHEL